MKLAVLIVVQVLFSLLSHAGAIVDCERACATCAQQQCYCDATGYACGTSYGLPPYPRQETSPCSRRSWSSERSTKARCFDSSNGQSEHFEDVLETAGIAESDRS